MTKLTDLNRANEALPAKNVRCHHQNINPEQLCYVCKGENDVVDSLGSVHLEVDVEAMAQKIYEYEHPNDTHWDNLTDGQKHEYIRKADFLTLWLTKWARMVRK